MTEPTMRVLSLGAGVQSTALLILAARGDLEPLDYAIFADTGWEPKAVYEHLDRITREVAEPAGIKVILVSNGNIRDDALSADRRVAMLPLFTLGPARTVSDPILATCPACSGQDCACGLDDDYFDTHDECPDHCRTCDGKGTVKIGERPPRPASREERGLGITRRQCTRDYKLVPINRAVRELLGGKPRVDGVMGMPPNGSVAEQWIGFSTDEAHRAIDSKTARYQSPRWPLLELGLSRADCMAINTAAGFPETPKSACIGCPHHRNDMWREMRDHRPDDWADAVDFDRGIRGGSVRAIAMGHPLRGEAFLHESRLPLDQAPIDRVTRGEVQRMQGDILDDLKAAEIGEAFEADEPIYGCGPYVCRLPEDPVGEDDEETALLTEMS